MALDGSSVDKVPVRPHCSEVQTIQALMELDLPRFESLGDGPRQVHRPWMVSTESPALPDPGGFTEPLRSSSLCLNLDTLSSDDTEGSVGINNLAVTLLCSSDDGHTPVNSDQVLSDEDLPRSRMIEDRLFRFGIYLRTFRLWIFPKGGSGKWMPLSVCVPATTTSGRDLDDAPGVSASDPSPVVEGVALLVIGPVVTIQLSSPPRSGQLSPASPRTVAFEDFGDSSVPLSPNRVRAGNHRRLRKMAVCRHFLQDF